jgi:hypothetical protein
MKSGPVDAVIGSTIAGFGAVSRALVHPRTSTGAVSALYDPLALYQTSSAVYPAPSTMQGV